MSRSNIEAPATPETEAPSTEPTETVTETVMDADLTGTDGVDTVTISSTPQEVDKPVESPVEMPEKFANAEDPQAELLKAYLELEKMKNSSEPKEEPKADEEPAPEQEDVQEDEEEESTEPTLVEKYQDLWAQQDGSLTDEQWAEVSQGTGVPLETLKAYEAGQKALLENHMAQHDALIYKASGGEESYNTMIQWASEGGLTGPQIDNINAQLDNPLFAEQGVATLKAAYVQAVGYEPQVRPSEVATSAVAGSDEFMSMNDFRAGQRHPEYGKGGKYDREFDAKAMRFLKRQKQA